MPKSLTEQQQSGLRDIDKLRAFRTTGTKYAWYCG